MRDELLDVEPGPSSYEAIPGTFNLPRLVPEIAAVGLTEIIKVYYPDRVEVDPDISAADRARVMALVAAHDGAPAPAVTEVSKLTVFRRCTEDEADRIDGALQSTSTRNRQIFNSAQNFRSDAEEWQLLYSIASGLFGDERADELLAPDDPVAA